MKLGKDQVECEDCGAVRNIKTNPDCAMCKIPESSLDRKKHSRRIKQEGHWDGKERNL